MSDVAEGLKVLAKATRTIIIIASQVARKEGDEIGLHDAKDSGSLENSAQLVLGIWRDEQDAQLLNVRVLKSTKGGAGLLVACNYDGAKSLITERSKIAEQDVPKQPYADA
jgi:replicative DNA helicase